MFEHLWSIAVEEQFYVVWPIALFLIATFSRRRLQQRVALVAVLASLVSLLLMVLLFTGTDPSRVYTGTDARTFSLLLGAAMATVPVSRMVSRVVARHVVVAQLLLLRTLALLWLFADGTSSTWLYRGGLFAHSLLTALLVMTCARTPESPITRALS